MNLPVQAIRSAILFYSLAFLNSASVKLNILLSRGNFSPTDAFRNSERLVQSRDTGYEIA